MLTNKAKNSEWKNPLCPKKWLYGMPKANPIVSVSGTIEQAIARGQKLSGTSRGANAIPAATATAACESTDGTITPSL